MKRRSFINHSLAGTSAFLSSKDSVATNSKKTTMEVLIFGTNWGFSGSLDGLCEKLKTAGYDGLELWWPTKTEDQKALFESLKKYDLKVGFLIGGSDKNFEIHFKQFAESLKAASSHPNLKPLYLNCHSGKDFFSFEENLKFLELTEDLETKTGIEIYHETHRGRMCFAAHITKAFLDRLPKTKLTLDISHWTNVHESMLDNQQENVDVALRHVGHIHARVGHEEGPQVSDPRAPEWKYALEKHLGWWDTVVAHREKTGKKRITFLTEFGPPNYLPTMPFTKMPIANQWEINLYMQNLLKERYKA